VYQTFKKFGTQPVWLLLTNTQIDSIMVSIELMQSLEAATTAMRNLFNQAPDRVYCNDTDPRVKYHMGALYLTGAPRKEFQQQAAIGLVGSFLLNIMPKSTLAASPIVKSKYQGSDSYDDDFNRYCQDAATSFTVSDSALRQILGVSGTPGLASKHKIVNLVKAATDKDITAAYETASGLIHAEGPEAGQAAGPSAP